MSGMLAALLLTPMAHAIVVRHDVDPEHHRCHTDCPASTVYFELGGRFGAGTGTLVAPNWILTAAHVADHLEPGDGVHVGDEKMTIAAIELHPRAAQSQGFVDAALVRLTQPVSGIVPARMGNTTPAIGTQVTFVGAGQSGNGLDGLGRFDRVPRWAHNRIEDTPDHWLVFHFDAPESAPESTLAGEGISGPGDSGGPAYDQGETCLLGVSSWQNNVAQDGVEGVYGVQEYYVRVDAIVNWLRDVLGEDGAGRFGCPASD